MLLSALLASAAIFANPAPFRLIQRNGVAWLQDPSGKPLWSFGVCCTDPGLKPKEVKPENPGYSGMALYGSEAEWARRTAEDLRSWGFNSLGGWSDADLFEKHAPTARLPFFPVLHLGAYDKAPWHDLFAPQMANAIDGAAKTQIAKLRNDPLLVGYFTDNELGWWTDTLFLSYLKMPSSSPGKKVLMDLVRSHYGGNLSRLKRDWKTSANSFEELAAKPDLRLRTGGNGIRLVDAWTSALASQYYSMVYKAVRKYDPKHLILGDRYCQYYDLPVVRAAAPYVDAISTNMGADWTDGGTSRFFLETLNKITRKPVIVTEFYMTAMENQSGNRNSSGGFPIVQTQAERAAAFGKNVSGLAARPYVIGAHWFQFYDEPPKGRGDGEDYNMGLVDIHGKPYPLLTQVAAGLDVEKRHTNSTVPAIKNFAPPASPGAMEGLRNWDRARALVAPSSGIPFADLYASWRSDALYVGIYAMDYVDEHLYEGDRIPEGERPTWTVKVAGMAKPLTVRYGGDKRKPSIDAKDIEVSELPGLKHTVILRIPVRLIGKASLQAGQGFAIESHLASHSRAETMSWRREVRLAP